MNAFLQHLIEQYDYQLDHSELTITPTHNENSELTIAPISQQTLIQCQGLDAAKFLQGQLTCDVQSITPEQSQFAAHCTPKGRALSSFRLAKLDDETFLMGCHHSVKDIIEKQLGKYIVFSKATLSQPSNDWVCIAVEGSEAKTHLSQLGFNPDQQTSLHNSALCIKLGDSPSCYEIWSPALQAISLWDELAKQAKLGSSSHWDLCLIEAGIAQIRVDTSDAFVPQMLNFDAIEAISFTKGCYTGQEIIARAKYRGQVKRRMIRARVENQGDCAAIARIGDSVLLDEKEVGSVVLSAQESSSTYQILAVVKNSALDSDQLVVKTSESEAKNISANDESGTQTQILQVLTLPYAINK